MAWSIVPCTHESGETVRALMRDDSLAGEYGKLALPGVFEDAWSDPFADPARRWLAVVDGRAVGFCLALVLPSDSGAWAMIRLGVVKPHRSSGIGTALLETCLAHLVGPGAGPPIDEYCLAAWLPAGEVAAFAARHAFHHARYFWKMVRPRGSPPRADWPAGTEPRVFDGGEAMLRDWNDAYLASFANHFHFVRSSLEQTRAFTRQRTFRPDGLILAYRDGRCVGFCRNTIREREGEVALLGVVPEARGLGLGRALLRWSVAWLERMDAEPIVLAVDGENESALALYRSEGFQVERTREFWARSVSSSARPGSRSPLSARSSSSSSP